MVEEMLRVLNDTDLASAVYHVNSRFSWSIDDIGDRSLRKLLLVFRYVFQCLRLRVRLRNPLLYYVPGPVKWSPIIRDWILLATLRPFFPKVVFHWHAIGHGEWAHGSSRLSLPGPEWLDKSARVISRLLLYKPDFSIAVSRNSTNDARAIDSRHLCVIPNGIVDPWPDYDLRIRQTRLERAANLAKNPQEPLRLLFLSRGTVEKGLPDALNAVNDCLSSLTAMTRPIHLTIAGGMDQATQRHVSAFLSVMASTHGQKFDFNVLDFVTGADKLRCYENADVFLAPSHWESFGLTVAEALAAGLIVVAAASDGVMGVLPENYPYLSPVFDTDQFARNLHQAGNLLTSSVYLVFIDSLRAHFLQLFTDQCFTKGIEELFGSICFSHSLAQDNDCSEGRGNLKLDRNIEPTLTITQSRPPFELPPSTSTLSTLDSSISVSTYLADQNPGHDRSFGISRMSSMVFEALDARGGLKVHAISSRSSLQAPKTSARNRVLPWRTRNKFVRFLTDHLHPLISGVAFPSDIFYFPKGYLPLLSFLCRPSVVTIHDTIIQYDQDHYPKWRCRWEYAYWSLLLRHTLRKADRILTVSESSREQIRAFMARHKIPAREITITYESCAYENVAQPDNPKKGDNVIHLASVEPHKRTAHLIRWWYEAEVNGKNLPSLHLIGSIPPEVLPILSKSKNIVKRPFLEDHALQEAYKSAKALILPSEIEGFGLPALEAYYLGTPVCFVKGTSVGEVLSASTHRGGFSLESIDSMISALEDVMSMTSDEVRTHGLKLRETYTSEKVAARLMVIFQDLVRK
jgi:glycosyltransferase involved in cell wall biosynthesis